MHTINHFDLQRAVEGSFFFFLLSTINGNIFSILKLELIILSHRLGTKLKSSFNERTHANDCLSCDLGNTVPHLRSDNTVLNWVWDSATAVIDS